MKELRMLCSVPPNRDATTSRRRRVQSGRPGVVEGAGYACGSSRIAGRERRLQTCLELSLEELEEQSWDEDEAEGQETLAIGAAPLRRAPAGQLENAARVDDPLVEELATRVTAIVADNIQAANAIVQDNIQEAAPEEAFARVAHVYDADEFQSREEAKELIVGAERAARKAQHFAIMTARAFGDVADKMKEAAAKLDV